MKPRFKEGYFPAPPVDTFQDLRSECVRIMRRYGIIVEKHHHEVATAGQGEIDMRYDALVKMADNVMAYKYVVKKRRQESWAGRHLHAQAPVPRQRHRNARPPKHLDGRHSPVRGDGYAGISELGLNYIGGLLAHAPALMAFLAPTTNSYKRLVPGFEAPTILALSARNRSAAAQHPRLLPRPQGEARRIPAARSHGEPVSGLRRDAHGRPRRDPEQDWPGRPG